VAAPGGHDLVLQPSQRGAGRVSVTLGKLYGNGNPLPVDLHRQRVHGGKLPEFAVCRFQLGGTLAGLRLGSGSRLPHPIRFGSQLRTPPPRRCRILRRGSDCRFRSATFRLQLRLGGTSTLALNVPGSTHPAQGAFLVGELLVSVSERDEDSGGNCLMMLVLFPHSPAASGLSTLAATLSAVPLGRPRIGGQRLMAGSAAGLGNHVWASAQRPRMCV